MSARDVELTFQTNPRGVGGTSTNWSEQAAAGFRPTLVGSEVTVRLLWTMRLRVSDQPSWGRRDCINALCCGFRNGFRPTLVGSEERTIVEGELKNNGFRPTLVGSEDLLCCLCQIATVSFRPTLVGSEGSLPRLGKSPDRRFQTNPRGVGGSTVPVCA